MKGFQNGGAGETARDAYKERMKKMYWRKRALGVLYRESGPRRWVRMGADSAGFVVQLRLPSAGKFFMTARFLLSFLCLGLCV